MSNGSNAIWTDFVSGTLASTLDAVVAGTPQSMLSEGLRKFPAVVAPNIVKIALDPFSDAPELIHVTAHTNGANTATIVRLATPPQPLRQHITGETWVHGPTAEDFNDFQTQLDNQFHTSIFTAANQTLVSSASNTPVAVSVPLIGSPWGELKYTSSSATADLDTTDRVVSGMDTGNITVAVNRIVVVAAKVPSVLRTSSGSEYVKLYISDGSDDPKTYIFNTTQGALNVRGTAEGSYRFVTTSSPIRFKLRGFTSGGTVQVTGADTFGGPMWIRVEDKGPKP